MRQVISPDGKIFPSKSAMCRAYGVLREVFKGRIKTGWTPEEALGVQERKNCKCSADPLKRKYKKRGTTYDRQRLRA